MAPRFMCGGRKIRIGMAMAEAHDRPRFQRPLRMTGGVAPNAWYPAIRLERREAAASNRSRTSP